MVFGLALKDLVDQIRSFVEKEVQKDYVNTIQMVRELNKTLI